MEIFTLLLLTCSVSAAVAVSDTHSTVLAKFFGDPHFQGADGIHFDFTGNDQKSYCLFSSPDTHVNMKMRGYNSPAKGPRTWVKSLGMVSHGHTMEIHAHEGVFEAEGNSNKLVDSIIVDGQVVHLPAGQKIKTLDKSLSLESVGNVAAGDKKDYSEVFLFASKAGLRLRIRVQAEIPENQLPDDSLVHISVEVLEVPKSGPLHGVMGQTFRKEQRKKIFTFRTEWSTSQRIWKVAGPNGEDYLDGTTEDYETSRLLATDCKMSAFVHDTNSKGHSEIAHDSGVEMVQGTEEGAVTTSSSETENKPMHVFRSADGLLKEEQESFDNNDEADLLSLLDVADLEELPIKAVRPKFTRRHLERK